MDMLIYDQKNSKTKHAALKTDILNIAGSLIVCDSIQVVSFIEQNRWR